MSSDQTPAEDVKPTESIWNDQPVVVYAPTPGASGNSIVALVLSICSWVVFPIVFAIVALVFASKADKEIRASGGAVGGGAFVTAAKIVSWINIGVYAALAILAILALLLFTILGVTSGSSS